MLIPRSVRPWFAITDPTAAVAFIAAAVLLAIGGWQILQARDQALADAENRIVTLSHALVEHAKRTIQAVDLTLLDTVEQVESGRDANELAASLRRREAILAQARNVVVIGADGHWIADGDPPHAAMNSADRSYFQWHRDHTDRGLHVDDPAVGRTDEETALSLSRRIDRPDGSFGGLVLITLAPDYVEGFYRTVATGSQGTIAMWTGEGRLLFRFPNLKKRAANYISVIVAHAYTAGSASSQSRSPFDGVERRTVFARVDGLPLVVSASISTADALANWSRSAGLEAGVLVAAALALALVGIGLRAHRRRLTLLQDQSRAADERYRLLAENASDLITLRTDPTGPRSYVSPSCRAMVGWEPEELAVMALRDFVHPEDQAGLEADVGRLTRDTPRILSCHRVRHRAGHYIRIEAVLTLTREGGVLITSRDVTARHRAEQGLAESEARFRSLADASSDMIQQLDLSGRRLYLSPASIEIFGRAPGDLVGTHPADFILDSDAARVRDLIAEVAQGRRDQARSVHQIRHADGHAVFVEVQFRLVRDRKTNRPLEIVSSVRDITERETLQRQHTEANRSLRLAEEIAHVGHWRVDLPATVTWSDEVYRIHGLDPATYQPTVAHAMTLYHPEDRAEVERCVAAAVEVQRPFEFCLRILRPDGETRDVLSRGLCETDADGEVKAVFGTIMDVTDLRRAERSAVASEARYRILAEATSDVITQIDLSMTRRYVSPSCRHLLGFEPEALIGLRPSDSIHPDEVDAVRAVGAKLLAGEVAGDRVVMTYRTLHREGHWVWVEAGMNLVRDPANDTPLSLICSLRDVTARQETAQQLERARAAAEHAVLMKSEFVANMSHELRTPLTGILGINDLLRRDPTLNAAQKRLVELASDAGTSLLAIVNDVLDFSKIEAGQLTIESVAFDLPGLVASCRDLTRGALAGKPVEIRTELRDGVPRGVVGDPTRLRQVLLNLMTNAIKFTPRGHVEVDVAYDAARGWLRVDIVDTGIGIPADRRDTLFDRFTQADTSMTRRYGGTGLGLAICRRLLDLMGGRIGLDSRTQVGAHFWFELPMAIHEEVLRPPALPAPALPAPALPAPALPAPASRRPHHVLLAEDNAINAEIIACMLETRGFAVTVVADGAAAVAALAGDHGFSIALMDLQMPVMDGLSATAEIRRREGLSGRSRLPVVGLTANATAEDAAQCFAAGMTAHVVKPIVWSHLWATIDGLVGKPPDEDLGAIQRNDSERHDDALDLDPRTLDQLAAVVGGNALATYLDGFTAELKDRLGLMMQADEREIARQAHMLTSSAGQLGFLRLSRLASTIEREARTTRPTHLLDILRVTAERAVSAAACSPYARFGTTERHVEPERMTGEPR